MRSMIGLVGALAASLVGGSAWGQPAAAPAVRSLNGMLEPIREQHGVPALGAALVRGGIVEAIGAVGRRRADRPEPVTTDDLWHLGSCTKAMTATLVARLVERGTLSWSATLPGAFPGVEIKPAWEKATIEQLLANRAGVPNDLARTPTWLLLRHGQKPLVDLRRAVVEYTLAREPLAPPGTRMEYSNTGFIIAGHAAEVATGRSWEELMREEVFGPLGMTGASFGPPGTAADDGEAPDQPRGHSEGRPFEPGPSADNPAALGPAGTVHASLADWARFIAAHVRGARGEAVTGVDGRLFLSADSFRRLHTPLGGEEGAGYALGWSVTTRGWARGPGADARGAVLVHNGSNTLWFCVAWVAPERDAAILVVCNAASAQATDAAASGLVRMLD